MKLAKKSLTIFLIISLAFISACNYQIFVFPNQFAPAGLNGICTMIQYVFGISVGYLNLIINVPLALVVYKKVGKTVALRSLIYVFCFSFFLLLLDRLDLQRFAYETANGTSMILGPLVAGIINGVCYSLLLRCNSSSGGSDFVAAIIHRSHPEQSFFWIIFLLNTFVALASFFVYDYQVEPVILCIIYCFLSSTVSDQLLKKGRSAIRCEIITEHPEELSRDIIQRLHHSATLIPARGMYLGKETNILICIVNHSQLPVVAELVQQYPGTFAVLSTAMEVMGNFKRLNPQGHPESQLLDTGDGKTV